MPHFAETPVTLLLLVVNVLVSGYALYGDQGLLDRLSFRPRQIVRDREYYRLVTAGFVHGGLGHLAVNMLTLYFFGPYLEAVLGSFRFLVVYLGAELTAHAVTLWRHRDTPGYAAVGASGAISGVVFAFCLFRPFELLYVFFALPIPAWLFAILFVGVSVAAMRSEKGGIGGGIAHEAHIGGALGGLVLTMIVQPRALSVFLSQLGF
jgi:membrane associated rhomboid family serine protease